MSNMDDIDRMANIVATDIQNKNVVTESEFNEFLPLFDNSIRVGNKYDRDFIKDLIARYRRRFNLNHCIVVISNDRKRIIEERPPMFLPIPSLNSNVEKAGDLMAAYGNIMSNDAMPAQKKDAISQVLNLAVTQSLSVDAKLKGATEKAVSIIEKRENKKVKAPAVKSTTDDFVWK